MTTLVRHAYNLYVSVRPLHTRVMVYDQAEPEAVANVTEVSVTPVPIQ